MGYRWSYLPSTTPYLFYNILSGLSASFSKIKIRQTDRKVIMQNLPGFIKVKTENQVSGKKHKKNTKNITSNITLEIATISQDMLNSGQNTIN